MSQTMPPLEKTLKSSRVIGHLKGNSDGPTVIFFAGIHGNEPAGVLALQKVFEELNEHHSEIEGEVIGLVGNLKALEQGVRFQVDDLNRIWNQDRLNSLLNSEGADAKNDDVEMLQLYHKLQHILAHNKPPFYFIDLHTTSSETDPFIVMNDSLLIRKFVSNYPLPKILGIEEYLTGALLSYINEYGYVAFGFESGQHKAPEAVTINIDFINYTLLLTGSIDSTPKTKKVFFEKLGNATKVPSQFYEIKYEHKLRSVDSFKMVPGFVNFQKVKGGTTLAEFNGEMIKTKRMRQLFMPLYQNQGGEGFYYIKKVPFIFLMLSKFLRHVKMDHVLTLLPGVQWRDGKKDTLLIDLHVAKFFAKPVLHLLGYRARQKDKDHLIAKNREAVSQKKDYINTSWYK
ncbi:MAG: aspartoacylase [Croceitalea sp.]|nr:aspartoacylase [Croceitalea sp.]